jgi:competence protein ComEC
MSRRTFAAPIAALVLVACQQTPVPVTPTKLPVDPGKPAQETPKESPVAAPARRFEIDVVDVGTGLAVLVQGPDFAMVYDGGSNDDLALGGSNRFLAYLRAVAPQRRTIDHLVLSHPHRDHVELLPDLFANYAVGDVWDSGAVNDICGYRRFLSAIASAPRTRYHAAHGSAFQQPDARRRLQFPSAPAKPGARPFATASEIAGSGVARDGGPASTGPGKERSRCSADDIVLPADAPPVAGATIALGERASMTFLHVPQKEHRDDFNEESLVVRLDLDGVRVLLSGDAEAGGRASPAAKPTAGSVEGQLLAADRDALAADVWVVPHHGSKSSSRKATISAVHPKISIISAGPTEYATVVLPDAEVVAALSAVSEVFRTDLHDDTCPTNRAKIGPDNDGEPGGCDNVHVVVQGGVARAEYRILAD